MILTNPRAALACVVLVLSAMSCSSDSDRSKRPARAGDDDWYNNGDDCHYDCFGDFRCVDGMVYETPHGPLPCSEATEANLRLCSEGELIGECLEGCVEHVDYGYDFFSAPWTIVCNEGRPRVVGDACQSDEECQPVEQVLYRSYDQPERTLRCDEDLTTCVPPDHPDFMASCELSDVGPPPGAGDYHLAAEACLSGYCLIRFPTVEDSCQGCTLACTQNADCPAGSNCVSLPGLDGDPGLQLCVPKRDDVPGCIPID